MSESNPNDRRSLQRYRCNLDLRFTGADRRERFRGVGVACDLNHKSLRFQTDELTRVGIPLEVRIAWPERLQNVCGLELVLQGTVVQVGTRGTVVGIERYEFQTCGARSFTVEEPSSRVWSVA